MDVPDPPLFKENECPDRLFGISPSCVGTVHTISVSKPYPIGYYKRELVHLFLVPPFSSYHSPSVVALRAAFRN